MSRKSRSARRSREAPATEGSESTTPTGRRSKAVSALSRELADFLVEFSIVLHKRSMYPAGHPHLQDSASRFVGRLNALLEVRDTVTLGVARHRLLIESVTTDPNNALLRDLAHRLHRHRLASIQLTRGATTLEIESLLDALSADPQRGEGPIGKRLDRIAPWSHVRLHPVGYDRLKLRSRDSKPEAVPGADTPPQDSWVELAQLALANEQSGAPGEADPLVVADAIGRKSGEVAYDRVVLGYLARVAEEMVRRSDIRQDQLAQRISKLIGALDQDTLRRLLEASSDGVEQRKFVLNASQILAADAVLEVVQAAAQASHQTISHNLLRLLHKLAHHAEEGPLDIRAEAEGALRTNVARLVGDWQLEDPNPSQYNAILEGMVRRGSTEFSAVKLQMGCDPEIIIKMALELDCVGPPVYAAVEELVGRRELVQVANLLENGSQVPAAEQLWRYLATPERLELELAASPLDQDAVTILVERIGADAAESLLDRLASASDRSTRAAVLKQLLALGPSAGRTAVKRLPEAPWFLQRNILVLLGRLGQWPEEFSPEKYAGNADARIRREAIKLMLESAEHQGRGVVLGVRDADEGIVSLALTAALEACPVEAVPAIRAIALDPRRPSDARVLAIRSLGRSRTPDTLEMLRGLVIQRRRWLGPRLAPKSPELLAALGALTTYWREDPAASDALSRAQQHSDPDIRVAASAPLP
jgi:hypothetical protein